MKEYIIKTMIVAAAIFAPIKPLLLACGALIFADMVTGMLAARKRGESINSASMRRTLSKMLIYQIAIITGFVLEVYMLESLLPVSKIVGGVIGVVEFKSVLENVSVVAGQDIIGLVKEKLGSKNDIIKRL
jgi:hypothetical protein